MLENKVGRHRLQLLAAIIGLLRTMIAQQRGRTLHEQRVPYRAVPISHQLDDRLTDVRLSAH